MDNNQRGYPIKFPRSGSNNKFVKVTGRTFVEAAKTDYNLSEEYKTKVTYTDQKIISAYKMPHFENMIDDGGIDYGDMVLSLENPASVTNDGKEVDVTGLRVKTYVHILQTSYTLKSASKYLSGYCLGSHQYKTWKHQLTVYSQSEVRKMVTKKFHYSSQCFFWQAISSNPFIQKSGILTQTK